MTYGSGLISPNADPFATAKNEIEVQMDPTKYRSGNLIITPARSTATEL